MLVGKKAPEFSCDSVIQKQIKKISLADYNGKYKVLFFYPLDFTFVCPTELHAFQDQIKEFEKRNAQILAVSVDSVYCHQAWLEKPKEEGGISNITYPILSDINKTVSRLYDVLDEETGVAFRGLFIIDKNNIVQSVQVNNLSLGRNIQEVLRLIDAIEFTQKYGEVCPANWDSSQKGLKATHEGVKEYFKKLK